MANPTDPFSASIIPFEVPEQMRAFAEKGVSQARDNYAKFKDAAESHNGTIEAVFSSASKGASEYSAKLMEIMKANTTANLDFAPGADRREVAVRGDGAVDLARQASSSRPSPPRPRNSPNWPRRSRPRPPSRSRPAPRSCSSRPPDRIVFVSNEKARAGRPGLFVAFRGSPQPDGLGPAHGGRRCAVAGLAKAGRCT